MSDLNYYAAPPSTRTLPHRGGMIAWGVVAFALAALMGLGVLGSLFTITVLPAMAGRTMAPSAVLLMAVNVVVTGGLCWGLTALGVGCCRGRRWVGPVAVAGGGVMAAVGTLSIVPVTMGVVAGTAGQPQPFPGFAAMIAAFAVTFSVLFWIALPVAAGLWFRRPGVGATLAQTDPAERRWTDGAPVPLLAWTFACLWIGGSLILVAGTGAAFWFTRVVEGPAAASGVAMGLAVMAAGVACLRRRSTAAWAASVALLAVAAASAVTFTVAGDAAAYRRLMADRTAAVTTAFAPPPRVVTTSGPAGTTAFAYTAPPPPNIAGNTDPQLAPAMMDVAAVGFGFWARRRIVRTSGGWPVGHY